MALSNSVTLSLPAFGTEVIFEFMIDLWVPTIIIYLISDAFCSQSVGVDQSVSSATHHVLLNPRLLSLDDEENGDMNIFVQFIYVITQSLQYINFIKEGKHKNIQNKSFDLIDLCLFLVTIKIGKENIVPYKICKIPSSLFK